METHNRKNSFVDCIQNGVMDNGWKGRTICTIRGAVAGAVAGFESLAKHSVVQYMTSPVHDD